MDCISIKKLEPILIAVCIIEEVSPLDVLGKSKLRQLANVRKLFVYFSRAIHPSITYIDIGNYLNRHHSTIIHYINCMNDSMDSYPHEKEIIIYKMDRVRKLTGNKLLFEIKK